MFVTRSLSLGFTALLACGVAAAPASAQMFSPERFAIGVTAGSDGVGADLQYTLMPQLVLRGRGTYLDFDYGGTSSNLHYSARFKLSQGGGFADVHPFASPFMISLGAVAGSRRADLTAVYRRNVVYQGVTFTPAELGTAGGRATLSSPAPFVGLGFDNTFTTRGHIGFKVLAGAAFGHGPYAHLAPTSGLVTQYPALIEPDLAQAEHDVHHDGDFLAYDPQVSAGLTYRF